MQTGVDRTLVQMPRHSVLGMCRWNYFRIKIFLLAVSWESPGAGRRRLSAWPSSSSLKINRGGLHDAVQWLSWGCFLIIPPTTSPAPFPTYFLEERQATLGVGARGG